MTYTKAHKKATDKWRETHREDWNEMCRVNMKKQYEKVKEIKNKKDLARYYLKKELGIFMNILIE